MFCRKWVKASRKEKKREWGSFFMFDVWGDKLFSPLFEAKEEEWLEQTDGDRVFSLFSSHFLSGTKHTHLSSQGFVFLLPKRENVRQKTRGGILSFGSKRPFFPREEKLVFLLSRAGFCPLICCWRRGGKRCWVEWPPASLSSDGGSQNKGN